MSDFKSGVSPYGLHPVFSEQMWISGGPYDQPRVGGRDDVRWGASPPSGGSWMAVGPRGGVMEVLDRVHLHSLRSWKTTKARPALITSTRGDAHSTLGDHYSGEALDCRTGDIVLVENRQKLAGAIHTALRDFMSPGKGGHGGLISEYEPTVKAFDGSWFLVILETSPRPVGHLHISFRPPWWLLSEMWTKG